MAAPALAASIADCAICCGVTGTAGFRPGVSADPVTAHEIITLRIDSSPCLGLGRKTFSRIPSGNDAAETTASALPPIVHCAKPRSLPPLNEIRAAWGHFVTFRGLGRRFGCRLRAGDRSMRDK